MMAAEQPLGEQRVLVVEDEYFIALEIADTLTAEGAEIAGPVENVAKATKVVSEEHVDLCLLDIALIGGERSYPLVDLLSEAGVPVIFVTGYEREAIPSRYGKLPIIVKPFDRDILLKTIAEQLGAKRRKE